MKKDKSNPKKSGKTEFPDTRKIEKKIQTANKKKIIEVPDNVPENKPYPPSPEEIPERKEDDEAGGTDNSR